MNHTDRMQGLRLELPAQCMPVRFFACKPWESRCVATFPIPSCSLMEASSLRTLEFIECPLPLQWFKLSALTTLSLHRCVGGFEPNTMEEFLAMLSCMQDLKRLPFDRVLPIRSREFISSATFNTFQTIYLPHLSRLRVATALSTVTAFRLA